MVLGIKSTLSLLYLALYVLSLDLVDGMPGFISFQLLRPKKAGDPYIVITFWESEGHFKAWTQSDEFKEGYAHSGSLPPEAFSGHPKLEVFDVILRSATVEDGL